MMSFWGGGRFIPDTSVVVTCLCAENEFVRFLPEAPLEFLPPGLVSAETYRDLWREAAPTLSEWARGEVLPERALLRLASAVFAMAIWVDREAGNGSARVFGLSGGQGAGKSTIARGIESTLSWVFGRRVARVSLDDFYLTQADRRCLAASVHPLLLTRGVPGTHDVKLAQKLLGDLLAADRCESIALPVFDKAADERLPFEHWRTINGGLDVVLFEGWCVGARPQRCDALVEPINTLETREDAEGRWRKFVNEQLAGDYQALFARIDRLILLKVADMDSVYRFRSVQERKLADENRGKARAHIMNCSELKRFVMHYERLTRWILEEMPTRADVTLGLDSNHNIRTIDFSQLNHEI